MNGPGNGSRSGVNVCAVVRRAWSTVLEVDEVADDDNFFDAGGDSATALALVERLGRVLGERPPLRLVLEHPTPGGLATALATRRPPEMAPSVVRAPRTGRYPLSLVQQQSVLRSAAFGATGVPAPAHNGVFVHRVGPGLQPAMLADAFRRTLDACPVLRVRFGTDERGAQFQEVDPSARFELMRGTVTNDDEVRSVVERAWNTPLGDEAPRVRAELHSRASEWLLITVVDHDVFDGRSAELFLAALGRAYGALAAGSVPATPFPVLDYLDWSWSQRSWADRVDLSAVIEAWCAKRSIPPAADAGALVRAVDPVREPMPSVQASSTLASQALHRLRALGSTHHVGLHTVVMAAIQQWLCDRNGRERIVTFSVFTNRESPPTRDMIGWFTNKVPMFLDVGVHTTTPQLLRAVHEEVLEAHRLQGVPFVRWVERLQPDIDLMFRQPVFAMINYFEGDQTEADELALGDVPVSTLRPSVAMSRTAGLVVTVSVTEGGAVLTLSRPVERTQVGDLKAEVADLRSRLETFARSVQPGRPSSGFGS